MSYIQTFSEGSADDRDLLGGKGANLAEMATNGYPVPEGLTITTKAWEKYTNAPSAQIRFSFVRDLADEALEKISALVPNTPVLLSVRSGARVSMPGMMDTILNVGISHETLPYWSDRLGERAALDCYRRFLQMFGTTALGINPLVFTKAWEYVGKHRYDTNITPSCDAEYTVTHLGKAVDRFKKNIFEIAEFQDYSLITVMHHCIEAVFKSWNSERAKAYRKKYGYPDDWGTAVNVQRMVFGNLSDKSCSGVLFTRCPQTGESTIVGEFLPNAQGEDVVAGIRTPLPLSKLEEWDAKVAEELLGDFGLAKKLESHYDDMQDIEFTVEEGKLYLLQTRNGKRSAAAAFKIATDMIEEGYLSIDHALSRVTMEQYLTLSSVKIDPEFKTPPQAVGIGASPGIVTGKVVFTNEQALAYNGPSILVRKETSPDDFPGMNAAVGILTATGGMTSHAAVVARGMDTPCVTGCLTLVCEEDHPSALLGGTLIHQGTTLTLDGATGRVWVDTEVPILTSTPPEHAEWLLDAARGKLGEVLVTNPQEVLPGGRVYIPAGRLPCPVVREILEVCREVKATVTLDLNREVSPEEEEFHTQLGLASQLKTLPVNLLEQTPGELWRILLPPKTSATTQKGFKKSGWEVIRSIGSGEQWSDTTTVSAMPRSTREELSAAGVPIEEVLDAMVKAGYPILNHRIPEATAVRALFDLLGN